jgi:hypothetical protein
MTGIVLDKKHGVNPSLECCFFCNESKGIILFGKLNREQREAFAKAGLSSTGEAPRSIVLDQVPCDKCKGHMVQGIILISVRDGENGDNPYRTGGWVVVRDRVIEEFISTKELRKTILAKRVAFLPDEVWDRLGLPRGAEAGSNN